MVRLATSPGPGRQEAEQSVVLTTLPKITDSNRINRCYY